MKGIGSFSRGILLGAVASTLVLIAATALAGTGVGAVFNLGKTNSVNRTSKLVGATAGRMLQVTNTSARRGASGIGIDVARGKPPLRVDSSTKVVHLNADELDGRDSREFVKGSGRTYTLAVAVKRLPGATKNPYVPDPAVAPGFFNVSYSCPGAGQVPDEADIRFTNRSNVEENLLFRNDDYKDAQWSPVPARSFQLVSVSGTDLTTITVQGFIGGAQRVATVTVSTVVRNEDCHLQIQGLTTSA
jgi:hypothetical protein